MYLKKKKKKRISNCTFKIQTTSLLYVEAHHCSCKDNGSTRWPHKGQADLCMGSQIPNQLTFLQEGRKERMHWRVDHHKEPALSGEMIVAEMLYKQSIVFI